MKIVANSFAKCILNIVANDVVEETKDVSEFNSSTKDNTIYLTWHKNCKYKPPIVLFFWLCQGQIGFCAGP